jgi:hypothetical protein
MDANMVRIRDDHATVRIVVQEDLSHVDRVQEEKEFYFKATY